MQTTHAWSGATMKKKEKKNLPKVSEEKKEGERSSDSTRKGQKCNGRLMYKTKSVEIILVFL